MSSDLDTTRIVRSWLRMDEHERADRVLENVLARLDTTPQRSTWWPARRFADMNTNTKLAIAAPAVLLLAVVAAALPPTGDRVNVGGPSPAPRSSPTPQASPLRVPAIVNPGADYMTVGRNPLSIDGIRFSMEIPAGWEDFGRDYGNYITKDIRGPQGAEAVVYWTRYPGGPSAERCSYLQSRPDGESAATLAAAVSEVPGTELVTGPSDVTVGGLPTKHATFRVRDDVGCDPGFFFTYPNVYGGALWPETVPGDTIRVWIVDLPEGLLFIVGGTHADAGLKLEEEVQDIIESIQFE
jgi:hypothetical protein